MKVLIIIPAYNEEENIVQVIQSLKKAKPDVDYLVVNDCSKDHTKQLLSDTDASFMSNPINLGIGGTVQGGYLYARDHGYDIAVQMDGDGQHNPEYLAALLEPIIKEEADITIGSRFIKKEGFQSSFMRRAGINYFSWLIKIMAGVHVLDVTSGFRAVNRRFIELYAAEYAQDYPEPEAIVVGARHGARIREIPVMMNERSGGQSSINGLKTLYYMIKVTMAIVITSLSTKRER